MTLVGEPARQSAETDCDQRREAFHAEAQTHRMDGHGQRVALIQEAEGLIESFEARAPDCVARLHEHLVYLLAVDQQHERAVQRIEQFTARRRERMPAHTRVYLGMQLGYNLNQLGQTVRASRAYFSAAEHAREVDSRTGARALIEAAATARVLGDDDASFDYLRDALGLIRDSLASAPQLVELQGLALVSLGNLFERRLRSEERSEERERTIRLMSRAAQRALRVLGHEGQAAGFRSIALGLDALALARQGRFEEATSQIRKAHPMSVAAGSLLPAARFEVSMTESQILELAGDVDGAREAASEAKRDASARRSVLDETRALEQLANLAERTRDWEDAEALYGQAVFLSETYRARLGLQDWSIPAFAALQEPYRGLVRVRLATGDVVGAFEALEQTRARYLTDLRHHLQVRERLSPADRRGVDSLSALLDEARLQAVNGSTPTHHAALTQRVSSLVGEIEAHVQSALPETVDLDVAELQRTLQTDARTLISYFVDDAASTAFVVREDTIVAVPLEFSRSQLGLALEGTASVWRRRDAPDPAFALGGLHQLYRMLVAPVRPWVRGDRVAIIPDADMATIPFAMLTTAPAESYEDAAYLVREWTVGTEAAAIFVTEDLPRPTSADGILAFGFDSPEGSTWNAERFPRLDHVEEEVASVGRLRGSRTWTGRRATESRFKELAPGAEVVHVASHAEPDPAFPLYSRIGLAEDGDEDGTLYLYEILQTPLSASLVVLSGCSTASGQRRRGEGMIGLNYGMRAAGARATVATQWSVSDEAMAEVMGTMYRELAKGAAKDEALRRAQLVYLDRHEGLKASPFYWAAPVLSGDPSPLPIESSQRWGVWLSLLGVVAFGGVAWWTRHRLPHA